MPILDREIDRYPHDVLDAEYEDWEVFYTRSKFEKRMMRWLTVHRIPHYVPIVAHRTRSPRGRVRTSHLPLFTNYVFVAGEPEVRRESLRSNCVISSMPVVDGESLVADLRRIDELIERGLPVTLEEQLAIGDAVRVRSGPLKGQRGVVVQRAGERRLVVSLDFLQQGASVELDDFEVEPL